MSFDLLKLENQLCFPLYACAKEVVRKYKPFLDEIGLTYTQYIAMMVLWEHETLTIKELGGILYLDSGTLTPLLKRLEAMNLITRTRDRLDERNVILAMTEKGMDLRHKAIDIPRKLGACITLTAEEAKTLYSLLYKVLAQI